MPMLVTPKKLALESGVRPKGPEAPKPKKKIAKSLREVNEKLRRLGPYPMITTGPYDAEDYDALTRRRLDWTRQRRVLLALKTELSRRSDNEATRLRGTIPLAEGDSEGQKHARKNATRVRQSEAWRHKQLDGVQRQAEIELDQVIRAKLGGPALVAKYGRIGGGHNPYEISAAMSATWVSWIEHARIRGIDHDAVVDCIAQPLTLGDIEKGHGMVDGQGIVNHRRGLDLWAELRGWIRPGAQQYA